MTDSPSSSSFYIPSTSSSLEELNINSFLYKLSQYATQPTSAKTPAFMVLGKRGEDLVSEHCITYSELWDKIENIAAAIYKIYFSPGISTLRSSFNNTISSTSSSAFEVLENRNILIIIPPHHPHFLPTIIACFRLGLTPIVLPISHPGLECLSHSKYSEIIDTLHYSVHLMKSNKKYDVNFLNMEEILMNVVDKMNSMTLTGEECDNFHQHVFQIIKYYKINFVLSVSDLKLYNSNWNIIIENEEKYFSIFSLQSQPNTLLNSTYFQPYYNLKYYPVNTFKSEDIKRSEKKNQEFPIPNDHKNCYFDGKRSKHIDNNVSSTPLSSRSNSPRMNSPSASSKGNWFNFLNKINQANNISNTNDLSFPSSWYMVDTLLEQQKFFEESIKSISPSSHNQPFQLIDYPIRVKDIVSKKEKNHKSFLSIFSSGKFQIHPDSNELSNDENPSPRIRFNSIGINGSPSLSKKKTLPNYKIPQVPLELPQISDNSPYNLSSFTDEKSNSRPSSSRITPLSPSNNNLCLIILSPPSLNHNSYPLDSNGKLHPSICTEISVNSFGEIIKNNSNLLHPTSEIDKAKSVTNSRYLQMISNNSFLSLSFLSLFRGDELICIHPMDIVIDPFLWIQVVNTLNISHCMLSCQELNFLNNFYSHHSHVINYYQYYFRNKFVSKIVYNSSLFHNSSISPHSTSGSFKDTERDSTANSDKTVIHLLHLSYVGINIPLLYNDNNSFIPNSNIINNFKDILIKFGFKRENFSLFSSILNGYFYIFNNGTINADIRIDFLVHGKLFITNCSKNADTIDSYCIMDQEPYIKNQTLPPCSDYYSSTVNVTSIGKINKFKRNYFNIGNDVAIIHPITRRIIKNNDIGEIWISVSKNILKEFPQLPIVGILRKKDNSNEIELCHFIKTNFYGFVYNNSIFPCGVISNTILINNYSYYLDQRCNKIPNDFVIYFPDLIENYITFHCFEDLPSFYTINLIHTQNHSQKCHDCFNGQDSIHICNCPHFFTFVLGLPPPSYISMNHNRSYSYDLDHFSEKNLASKLFGSKTENLNHLHTYYSLMSSILEYFHNWNLPHTLDVSFIESIGYSNIFNSKSESNDLFDANHKNHNNNESEKLKLEQTDTLNIANSDLSLPKNKKFDIYNYPLIISRVWGCIDLCSYSYKGTSLIRTSYSTCDINKQFISTVISNKMNFPFHYQDVALDFIDDIILNNLYDNFLLREFTFKPNFDYIYIDSSRLNSYELLKNMVQEDFSPEFVFYDFHAPLFNDKFIDREQNNLTLDLTQTTSAPINIPPYDTKEEKKSRVLSPKVYLSNSDNQPRNDLSNSKIDDNSISNSQAKELTKKSLSGLMKSAMSNNKLTPSGLVLNKPAHDTTSSLNFISESETEVMKSTKDNESILERTFFNKFDKKKKDQACLIPTIIAEIHSQEEDYHIKTKMIANYNEDNSENSEIDGFNFSNYYQISNKISNCLQYELSKQQLFNKYYHFNKLKYVKNSKLNPSLYSPPPQTHSFDLSPEDLRSLKPPEIEVLLSYLLYSLRIPLNYGVHIPSSPRLSLSLCSNTVDNSNISSYLNDGSGLTRYNLLIRPSPILSYILPNQNLIYQFQSLLYLIFYTYIPLNFLTSPLASIKDISSIVHLRYFPEGEEFTKTESVDFRKVISYISKFFKKPKII